MRTLPTEIINEKNSQQNSTTFTLTIHSPIATIYISDRNFSLNGITYNGWVTDWGTLKSNLKLFRSKPSSVNITLSNTINEQGDRFSDLIRADDMESVHCIISQVFFNIDTDEPISSIEIFNGKLNFGLSYNEEKCIIELVELSEILNPLIGTIITKEDFPNAPDESLGKVAPRIYGALEPFLSIPIKDGARTSLDGVLLIGDGASGINVYSASLFPLSGTILIDDEKISYTSRSSDTFLGITRGVNGTQETDHLSGAIVIEVKDSYDFLVASHPCKYITDVKIDNQPTQDVIINTNYVVNGKTFSILSFSNRPRKKRYIGSPNFLYLEGNYYDDGYWDTDGSTAINPNNAIDENDTATYATINKSNRLLKIVNKKNISNGEQIYGSLIKPRLRVKFFQDKIMNVDYVSIKMFESGNPIPYTVGRLATASPQTVSLDFSHTHSDTFSTISHNHSSSEANHPSEDFHTLDNNRVYKTTLFMEIVPRTENTYPYNSSNAADWYKIVDRNMGSKAGSSGWFEIARQTKIKKGWITSIKASITYQSLDNTGTFNFEWRYDDTLSMSVNLNHTTTKTTYTSNSITPPNPIYDWDKLTDNQNTYFHIESNANGGSGGDEKIVVEVFEILLEIEYTHTVDTSSLSVNVGNKENILTGEVQTKALTDSFDVDSQVVSQRFNLDSIPGFDFRNWNRYNLIRFDIEYLGSTDNANVQLCDIKLEIEYKPYSYEITNNITCLVEGLYNGNNELITNPADVILDLYNYCYGEGEIGVDEDSFGLSRQYLDEDLPIDFAGAIRELINLKTLSEQLGLQCACHIFLENGKLKMLPISPNNSPIKNVNQNCVKLNTIAIARADFDSIYNCINLLASLNYSLPPTSPDIHKLVKNYENIESIERFGEKKLRLKCHFIDSEESLNTLGNFYKDFLACVYDIVNFHTTLTNLELERLDVIEIEYTPLNLKGLLQITDFETILKDKSELAISGRFIPEVTSHYLAYWNDLNYVKVIVEGSLFFIEFVINGLKVAQIDDFIIIGENVIIGNQNLKCKGELIEVNTFSSPGSESLLDYDFDNNLIYFNINNDRVLEINNSGDIIFKEMGEILNPPHSPISQSQYKALKLDKQNDEIYVSIRYLIRMFIGTNLTEINGLYYEGDELQP